MMKGGFGDNPDYLPHPECHWHKPMDRAYAIAEIIRECHARRGVVVYEDFHNCYALLMFFIQRYKLEIIVFITGAAVMILELTGSRIIAPYVGTSIFVWTSLIGVILGSLSVGYWWGGKLADKGANFKTFSLIIFIAAVLTGATSIFSPLILTIVSVLVKDVRLGSIMASILLFAAPSIVLGMVSPYALRLKIRDVSNSGAVAGGLYAVSTIGSIAGTFLGGFYLITLLGSAKILLFIAIILILTSFFAYYKKSVISLKTGIFIYFVILLAAFDFVNAYFSKGKIVDIDTHYNRVFVFETIDSSTQRPIRVMTTSFPQIESAMFLDDDNDLVAEYLKFFRIAGHFNPGSQKTLLIGGACYSYPKDFLKRNLDAFMDVVEIDPSLTALARRFFNIEENPRLAIYHEDGRTFLNRGGKKYDVIFMDAFKSIQSIPYQLTTAEAMKKAYEMLANDGVLLLNIISSIDGVKGRFFRAEYWTLKYVFPYVYVIPVAKPDNGNVAQNLLLIALKNKKEPLLESEIPEFNGYLSYLWKKEILRDMPLLTDDFAPVDNYALASFKNH